MADIEATRLDFQSALLDLQHASKENLELLVQFLEQSLGKKYAHNHELVHASEAVLKEIVKEDIVYGNAKTNPDIYPNLIKQLDATLTGLNQLNNARKQLLASTDKVKLSESMLHGTVLPKEKAKMYGNSLAKILQVTKMTAELQHSLTLEMRHGKNFSNMSPQELAALHKGITQRIDTLYATNKQMKEGMKKGAIAPDDKPDMSPGAPNPFSKTLKRGKN